MPPLHYLTLTPLHIEPLWGLDQLNAYLAEVALLEAGAPYTELGIGQRRHATQATVIDQNGALLGGPEMLSNTANTKPMSYAHLKLEGVMRSTSAASSYGVPDLIRQIQSANANANVDGILIEANTGGGEGTAGQMLHAALSSSSKAVVVYAHYLASAGIMGTMAADEIVSSAAQGQFGSIGTFYSIDKKTLQEITDRYQHVYAKKSVNKNEEFRALEAGDFTKMEKLADQYNDFFLADVAKHRPLAGNIEETLSGRMFFAQDAKRRGLVDSIGNFNYAIQRLAANVRRRKNM